MPGHRASGLTRTEEPQGRTEGRFILLSGRVALLVRCPGSREGASPFEARLTREQDKAVKVVLPKPAPLKCPAREIDVINFVDKQATNLLVIV